MVDIPSPSASETQACCCGGIVVYLASKALEDTSNVYRHPSFRTDCLVHTHPLYKSQAEIRLFHIVALQ